MYEGFKIYHDLFYHQLNRVKAVEKEKDELEGVKNEAVEFLNIQNNVCKEQNKLYQKNM